MASNGLCPKTLATSDCTMIMFAIGEPWGPGLDEILGPKPYLCLNGLVEGDAPKPDETMPESGLPANFWQENAEAAAYADSGEGWKIEVTYWMNHRQTAKDALMQMKAAILALMGDGDILCDLDENQGKRASSGKTMNIRLTTSEGGKEALEKAAQVCANICAIFPVRKSPNIASFPISL